MTLSDSWVQPILGFVITGVIAALIAQTTSTVNNANLKDLIDREAAHFREILREREKIDRLTVDGIRNELDWVKSAIQRIEKSSAVPNLTWKFAVVSVEELTEPQPEAPPQHSARVFELTEQLKLMRAALDVYLIKLKEGKITEAERERMHSLEIDYEIKRGWLRWQMWCENNLIRRLQCESLYGD